VSRWNSKKNQGKKGVSRKKKDREKRRKGQNKKKRHQSDTQWYPTLRRKEGPREKRKGGKREGGEKLKDNRHFSPKGEQKGERALGLHRGHNNTGKERKKET